MSRTTMTLIVGLTLGVCHTARAAEPITRPAVPANIRVDDAYKPFLVAHAFGTQNYICVPAATPAGVDWIFIGPQATLFDTDGEQTLTHFHSVNPTPAAIEATWQMSRDSSAVWATRVDGSTDANYVAPGAIEWLLLHVSGRRLGPLGGAKLVPAVYIQRVNTLGGAKPRLSDCTPQVFYTRKLVDYEADYYFYR